MPFFKTTYNILFKPDEDEFFDENLSNYDKLILPKKGDWDYKRELKIEDINLWEVIYQASGGVGVYAAYDPYAEFYMITTGWDGHTRTIRDAIYSDKIIETYYGKNAQNMVQKRMVELNIPFAVNTVWVDDDQMWLYDNDQSDRSSLIIY